MSVCKPPALQATEFPVTTVSPVVCDKLSDVIGIPFVTVIKTPSPKHTAVVGNAVTLIGNTVVGDTTIVGVPLLPVPIQHALDETEVNVYWVVTNGVTGMFSPLL